MWCEGKNSMIAMAGGGEKVFITHPSWFVNVLWLAESFLNMVV